MYNEDNVSGDNDDSLPSAVGDSISLESPAQEGRVAIGMHWINECLFPKSKCTGHVQHSHKMPIMAAHRRAACATWQPPLLWRCLPEKHTEWQILGLTPAFYSTGLQRGTGVGTRNRRQRCPLAQHQRRLRAILSHETAPEDFSSWLLSMQMLRQRS